jgi:DNA polymerase III delta prime subunit
VTAGALAPHVRRVRLAAEAALWRRRNAGAGLVDARTPGEVYVRDPAAAARMAAGTLKPHGAFKKAAAEVDAQLADADRALAGHASRLTELGDRFGLDAAARELLAVALAYELDDDARELIHALSPRRRPALWAELAGELCPALADPAARVAALHASAPVRRLLDVDGSGAGAAIALRRPTLAWLTGDDRLPPPLDAIAEVVPAGTASAVWLPAPIREQIARAAEVARGPGRAPAFVLRGPRGSGRRGVALELSRALGRPMLVCSMSTLVELERVTGVEILGELLTEAATRGAVAVLADVDALVGDGDLDPRRRQRLALYPGVLVFTSGARAGMLDAGRPSVAIAMPRASLDDREEAWRHAISPLGLHAATADELAGRYVLGPGAIAEVADEARRAADAVGAKVDRDGLEAAVGRRLSIRLGSFGTVVSRKAMFGELVLPPDVIDVLHDMIAMVRERSQILERWGYQRHLGLSRGVSALFSGEPGTGKTMAASVLASELGLELIRIDLATVVSKYVGETEKNLARIFDEAQDAHAMLLFDEADSLFGKRTELKSAQDRFANLEVNYILQRMESFDGISVLTTNAENAIDQALQRRLNFRIRFPEPEVEERLELWRRLLPPDARVDGDIDYQGLAERFEMTGGYIKNAIVRAAVIAARAGRGVTSEDLWTGALHEYAEMGKVMHAPVPGLR